MPEMITDLENKYMVHCSGLAASFHSAIPSVTLEAP